MEKKFLWSKKYDPESKESFIMSRSKIDLYLKCKRCAYLDMLLGIKGPKPFPYNLNSRIDTLLKAENVNDKKKIFNFFKRDDLRILTKMKIYEDHSEDEFCKILSKRDLNRLKKRIANYLLDKSDQPSPFIKIPEQLARLDTLKLQAESEKDDKKCQQLEKLDTYLVKMMNNYEKCL